MSAPYAKTFDFGRDVDGAYTAQPYFPQRERDEIRRWEALTKQPWNQHPAELMEDLSDLGRGTNHGVGPAWTDLCQSGGDFESGVPSLRPMPPMDGGRSSMATTTSVQNAIITSTMFGVEDHGILTCYVTCEGDGWGCGFGGYALDKYDADLKRRVGTDYGSEYFLHLFKAVGVEKYEQLKGLHVRVETEGLGGQIRRIGHILKDQWFDPKALAETYEATEGVR